MVRVIGVWGVHVCVCVCMLWGMVFRVACDTVGVIDVLCRWCVLRCGTSYTMCCIGDGRSGSVGCGIIRCCIFHYYFEVLCSLSPVNIEGNTSSCKLTRNPGYTHMVFAM